LLCAADVGHDEDQAGFPIGPWLDGSRPQSTAGLCTQHSHADTFDYIPDSLEVALLVHAIHPPLGGVGPAPRRLEPFCAHKVSSEVVPNKGQTMATRSNVRSVVADAQDKGREAVEAVTEVRDNVAVAIDKSLKKRPYTTLALTLAVGFLLGAMWAR
jgi:ElaB/YqjD/DUF883 family membrane-anchored ribosome-binding protein